MAHWTRSLGYNARQFVGSTSRYLKSRVLQYSEKNHTTFEIYKRKRSIPHNNDQWVEITKAVEYRPDLVSTEIYGAPDFWWRLLEHNGMKDILEFKAGQNIKIPGDILWQ